MTASTQALVLKKVTLRYNPVEDRLRLDAQDGEGGVHSFWLTQRLCLKLVGALLDQFDGPKGAAPAPGHDRPHAEKERPEVQAFLQDKAKAGQRTTEAVAHTTDTGVLLEKVQLRSVAGKGLQLILLRDPDGKAVLPMTLDETRVLLDIIYRQFRAGSWPLEVWPEWVKQSAGRGEGNSASLH